MKKQLLAFILSLILLLSAASVPARAAGEVRPEELAWTRLYENISQPANGFTYTNTIFTNAFGKRTETFAVETTPTGDVYPIVATAPALYNAMTVDELTAYWQEQGLNVYAAINADFFYSSENLPLGGVIRDGRFVSSLNNESLLAFTPWGAFYSSLPTVDITLVKAGGDRVPVNHLNKVRTTSGGLFLYTCDYHPDSTQTSRKGWAVRFKILEGKLTVSGSVTLRVEEVIPSCTDIAIGEGYMVLTSSGDGAYAEIYKRFFAGDVVTLETKCSDPRLREAVWATGCGDLIIDNGTLTDTALWDQAISDKNHPRTAIGIKADGSVMAYVVDGRRSNYSSGATLAELATEMKSRGCIYAVNLDGGGSSVMSVRLPGQEACTVVNRPSNGSPRKCSTYILFVSDLKRGGGVKRIHLDEDGALTLAGSSLLLNMSATDAAGFPAEVPSDVTVTAKLGTVVDGVYIAGERAGVDTLTFRSNSTGASGTATIHIVGLVDSLSVVDMETGAMPALYDMAPGDTAQFIVSARFIERDVITDGATLRYDITPGLGIMSDGEVFTALGDGCDSGEIRITAGGVTASVPVTINGQTEYSDIEGHWGEAFIRHLADLGVVEPAEDGLFSPDSPMMRQEFVSMLWRAVGAPVVEGECTFEDVFPDDPYYEAVTWGQRIGLTNGVTPTSFDPDGGLTREQAFTLVYRLLTILRKELPEPDLSVLDAFPDGTMVNEYAREAVATLIQTETVNGAGGSLYPFGDITRSELSKVTCIAVLNWTSEE